MVELGIGQHDAVDRDVADAGRDPVVQPAQLLSDVRRGVAEEPAAAVRADCQRRLRSGMRCGRVGAGEPAARTPAVPLRKTTTGGAAKENDVHAGGEKMARLVSEPRRQGKLLLTCVCGHFHGHGDDFGFWFGPLHLLPPTLLVKHGP